MIALDRDGIFKAVPVSWSIKEARETSSVAISIQFRIVAQLDGSEWMSWEEFEPHQVWGDFWIIKKDGTINQTTVEQLSDALGWSGSLVEVQGTPPAAIVQVTVKADEFNGVTRFKASWLNPGDYSPTPGGAPPEKVKALQARFGSLLRAAAGGDKAGERKAPPAKRPAPARPNGPSKDDVEAFGAPLRVEDTPF